MSDTKYWAEFWKEYGRGADNQDEQTQVLRTLNKQPISQELWEFTLESIEREIEPDVDDALLELCSGNGLISRHFSSKMKNIVAVDISPDLVKSIDADKYRNIEAVVSDIRDLDYESARFDKIIIYAGIQYLSLKESLLLFEKVYAWLKPGGIFFIGDIPDQEKRWVFYNTPQRQADYFNNLRADRDVVGTWFEADFFDRLCTYVGFSQGILLPQADELIYSKFRYDYKAIK